MELGASWSEMLWFVGTTVLLHSGVAVFWSAMFGFLDTFKLMQGAKFQQPVRRRGGSSIVTTNCFWLSSFRLESLQVLPSPPASSMSPSSTWS